MSRRTDKVQDGCHLDSGGTREELRYVDSLRRASLGDAEAFAWIQAREQEWISRVAREFAGRGRGMSDAEDLIQEAWMSFWTRRQPRVLHSRAELRAWLRTTMRHHHANELRRPHAVDVEVEEVAACSAPTALQAQTASLFQSGREQLTFEQEAILMLRDYCGCEYDVIASLLGCPTVGAAASLRSRALARLGGM